MYDFATNRLLICGVGPNDENCGIEVEKNLFTPRLGIAYRPMEDFVIRAGYSRNPQSNNPGRQQMVPSQSFPQTIVINRSGAEQRDGGRQLSARIDDRAAGRSEQRRAGAAARRRCQHLQGRIRAREDLLVERQRPEGAWHADERQVGYVANRQNGMTRNRNVNYGTLGGGVGEPAVQFARASRRR